MFCCHLFLRFLVFLFLLPITAIHCPSPETQCKGREPCNPVSRETRPRQTLPGPGVQKSAQSGHRRPTLSAVSRRPAGIPQYTAGRFVHYPCRDLPGSPALSCSCCWSGASRVTVSRRCIRRRRRRRRRATTPAVLAQVSTPAAAAAAAAAAAVRGRGAD